MTVPSRCDRLPGFLLVAMLLSSAPLLRAAHAPDHDVAAQPVHDLLDNIGSAHPWAAFCEGAPGDTVLPPDPRERIVPGVNAGRAVVFNAYWRDCDNPYPVPKTCGEYRAAYALGELVGMGQGQPGTANLFSKSDHDTAYSISAEAYNNLWRIWGLQERPDAFDRLVAERHGSVMLPGRNPYPLPGEDPNATEGGNGQLPMGYTQLRAPDGTWTGRIGVKVCTFCHNGAVGTAADGPGLGPQLGGAGTIGDYTVAFNDFWQLSPDSAFAATSGFVNIQSNRGSGAIDQFQLGFLLFSNGDWNAVPKQEMANSAAIGTIKSPNWWNMSKRTQKFHGALLPTDSSRIDMAAYYPLQESMRGGQGAQAAVDWVDAHAAPFQVWAEAQEAPDFPGEIDRDLARIGAVIFHELDLWDTGGDNPAPRPEGGNGSCAGCHGVHSSAYAHDPEFLESPELEGIAARVVRQDVVRTDSTYLDAMQSLRREDGSVNPEMYNNLFFYCGLGQDLDTTEPTPPTMLAPPLYGVWAAAPYFHNGSVPNLWGVLKPSEERPHIWRRVSTPAPEGLDVVMGFDTDLQRAYDFEKLGWKYEEVACGAPGTQPFVDCNPLDPAGEPPSAFLTEPLYRNFWWAWNLPAEEQPPFTNLQIENRKIYNTHWYAQGNEGHDFTAVLTDFERLALIEYLKTL